MSWSTVLDKSSLKKVCELVLTSTGILLSPVLVIKFTLEIWGRKE